MRISSRIFTSLLAVLFTIGQTSAQAGVAFTVVDTIIGWGSTIYSLQSSLTDNTSENVGKILTKVSRITSELTNLENHLSAQLDTMLTTLLNDIETTTELQGLKSQLLPYLHKVEHYFHDSFKYIPRKSYANSTLENFTERVLFGTDDLLTTLAGIHDIFIPGAYVNLNAGYVPLFIKKTTQNLPTDCQRYISPQQIMFYIYVQLMIAEMKALVTLKNVYETKSWLESFKTNYKAELKDAETNFKKGVRAYYKIFTEQLALLPRHLRRCHVNAPIRGVDYLELDGLSRIKFLTPDFIANPQCYRCPIYGEIDKLANSTHTHIHNCTQISHSVTACPPEKGSPRDYLSWQDESGTNYGADEECPRNTTIVRGKSGIAMGNIPFTCILCYCSVDEIVKKNHNKKSWRISVRPQISDIWNNMVVTGVRFIVKHKTIHLQIQQGNFSTNGLTFSDITWKNVNKKYYIYPQMNVSHSIDGRLGATKKTIYLDDITVPKGSVVTGVHIRRNRGSSNFMLWVHATEFNFITGELDPLKFYWCSRNVCKKNGSTNDYKRNRVEIDMGKADDPTRGTEFHYDPETNKMVTFRHTDIYKDGGQTTIPFFDAQPLQVQPAFPLSGVGLYYRGREGFGGYIAPRIFTLDVTQYMKVPKIDLNKKSRTTANEDVEWEIQDYDGKRYQPGDYLAYRVDKK